MSADYASLLILANSGRALAQSAVRGGFWVTVVDMFCDEDTLAVADCWPTSHEFSQVDGDELIEEMATLFPEHPCGVVYGAGLEEATHLLSRLSQCCQLYGNDPAVLELLGHPRGFFSLLNRLRIPYPEVCYTPPYAAEEKSWLIKRAGSCGGQGVAYFDPLHSAADSASYYQRHLSGKVMSVLFIANGKRHRTIGYNRLGMNGANAPAPFLYTGAVGQAHLEDARRLEVEEIVATLVADLALRGVNSLDFILNDDGLFVLDLNPRPTATLELYEHQLSDGWVKHHILACQGELPVIPIVGSAVMHGHQIVYAPQTIEIPTPITWPEWVKDQPSAGSRIAQGQPLCSLFAHGSSVDEVEAVLHHYQEEILQMFCMSKMQPEPRRVAL
ncbi:MAG: ATP-grasp domain-containing protein [Candidatus Thiodiazotropha sp.]